METKSKIPNNPKLDLINKARDVMRGEDKFSVDELKQLCKELERLDQFGYATEILLIMIKKAEKSGYSASLKDYQTLAKYIYKDHSLPSSFKFEKALGELKIHDNLLATVRCESLGLAGAIYKRKWQFDHQFRNLVLSKYYYKRGFDQWKLYIREKNKNRLYDVECNDDGYNAINYAYINELMAVDKLEEFSKSTGLTKGIINNLKEAQEARKYILKQFIENPTDTIPEFKLQLNLKDNPWIIATVAEAYFGLHNYDASFKFVKQYIDLQNLNQWEIRSFSKQLFSLAYLQVFLKKFYNTQEENQTAGYEKLKEIADQIIESKMNGCLGAFLGKDYKIDESNSNIEVRKDGKIGLALSGGGFRASLFHIGVLAALAENNELKNIEIISCVSGGSIIGACYYLKLKKLLEEKSDGNINNCHYLQIVKEIEKEFLEGVQKNLRMKVFSSPCLNLKMICNKDYSRSHRIGELYEKYLYNPIFGESKIYMHDLFITPKLEEGEIFSYEVDNWKRNNKIPQLVLNATSVNTGHNWQFTASWMGEPPGNIQTDIDVKPRLRRMYYKEAPEKYQEFRLGYAVAASACVPVMFEPMPLFGLYPNLDLQLVDGGLHDNQGIAALIEQECNNMIISDASGQMSTRDVATYNEAEVFYKTDNILQERLRELQFMDIKERDFTLQLDSLITIHLKNGFQAYPISWKNCIDPPRSLLYEVENKLNNGLLPYGILCNVQKLLSEIRTDLDSFNDIEAYALMYSGYAQTNHELFKKKNIKVESHNWNFLKIEDYLKLPAKAEKIEKILKTGKKLAFKVIDVSTLLKISIIVLGIILSMIVIWIFIKFYNTTIWNPEIKVKYLIWVVLVAILVSYKSVNKYINIKNIIFRFFTLFIPMVIGFIVSNIYLYFFNWIYNNAGRLKDEK